MVTLGNFFWVSSMLVCTLARTIPEKVSGLRDAEILDEEFFSIEPQIFENKILKALNKLKDFLKNGDPANGVPPLDPYFLSYESLDFIIRDTALKGFLKDVTFANFSRFEPTDIEFQLLPLHFKIDLFLDYLKIDGHYKLLGKILEVISVNGTGKFISETHNLSLSLYVKPEQVNSSFQIKDVLFEFKTLSEKINFTNELVSDELQELDENLALYILDQVQEKYVPPLLNMTKIVLNHFLLGYSFKDILKIILEFLSKN